MRWFRENVTNWQRGSVLNEIRSEGYWIDDSSSETRKICLQVNFKRQIYIVKDAGIECNI